MLTTRQIKAARALLGWSQSDLATASGISEPTVARLESIDGPVGGRAETSDRIADALQRAGIEFLNGDHLGVRLRRSGPPNEGLRPDQLTSENDG